MGLFKKIIQIFRKKSPDPRLDILFPGLVSVKQFFAFEPAQRMQAVMIVGDSGDVKFYKFMKWCVEQDPDLDVRLAALKRLPNYLGQADLLPFLIQLDKSSEKSELEPYLSMALFRTKLINRNRGYQPVVMLHDTGKESRRVEIKTHGAEFIKVVSE